MAWKWEGVGTLTLVHHLLIDLIAGLEPGSAIWAREGSLLRQAESTVKGHPQHNLAVCEMLLIVTYLPD
jgi:hypothetical protein